MINVLHPQRRHNTFLDQDKMPEHQMTSSFPQYLGLSHRQHQEIFLCNQRKRQQEEVESLDLIYKFKAWQMPLLQHSNHSTLYIDPPSFAAFPGTHSSDDLIRPSRHRYYPRSTSRTTHSPLALNAQLADYRPGSGEDISYERPQYHVGESARSRERVSAQLPLSLPRCPAQRSHSSSRSRMPQKLLPTLSFSNGEAKLHTRYQKGQKIQDTVIERAADTNTERRAAAVVAGRTKSKQELDVVSALCSLRTISASPTTTSPQIHTECKRRKCIEVDHTSIHHSSKRQRL